MRCYATGHQDIWKLCKKTKFQEWIFFSVIQSVRRKHCRIISNTLFLQLFTLKCVLKCRKTLWYGAYVVKLRLLEHSLKFVGIRGVGAPFSLVSLWKEEMRVNTFFSNVVSGVLVVALCNLFKIAYQKLKAKVQQKKERRSRLKDRRP